MLRLIKSGNIFGKFCKNIYIIKGQKRRLPYIHLLIFLYPDNQFLKASHIDKVICAEILISETDPSGNFTRIVTSIMLYGPCENINPHFLYMSNAKDIPLKCTKYYYCEFFKETTI